MVRDSETSAESKDPLRAGAENELSREFAQRHAVSWCKLPDESGVALNFMGSFDYVALRYRGRQLRSG